MATLKVSTYKINLVPWCLHKVGLCPNRLMDFSNMETVFMALAAVYDKRAARDGSLL